MPNPAVAISVLGPDGLAGALDDLADLLAACVRGGASVNFIEPFDSADARTFWRDGVFPAVAGGQRRLLVARTGLPSGKGRILGTVQLSPAPQPNQAHRADIAKLLVHPEARRQGIAERLMRAAEELARAEGRTLLTLDTRRGDSGERLYRRLGYRLAGVVPGYSRAAAAPRLEAASFYFKPLDQPSPPRTPCGVRLRDAAEADLAAVTAILNEAVANTTAVWSTIPATLESRLAWYRDRLDRGFPVLVAERAGRVVGFASYGDYRPWDGYARTVEHSIYVDAAARGGGIGAMLLGALVDRAAAAGKHAMIAGIDADNAVSLRLHSAFGFVEMGRLAEVGRKFGRWLDLVFMQRLLPEADKAADGGLHA